MGYEVYSGDVDSLVRDISSIINDARVETTLTVNCLNPHSLIVANNDGEFRTSLLSTDVLLPDGVGITLSARLLSGNILDRIPGPVFFEKLLAKIQNTDTRLFFLGSDQPTLRILEQLTQHKYGLQAASYSPPFADNFSSYDLRRMIKKINQYQPGIVWVGMTAPKQEKVIAAIKESCDVKVMCGVGAVFDYQSGKRKSPELMRHLGLEWLARLISDPKKMWRRNFVSTPLFIFHVIRNWYTMRI